jgi:hypothetical protein
MILEPVQHQWKCEWWLSKISKAYGVAIFVAIYATIFLQPRYYKIWGIDLLDLNNAVDRDLLSTFTHSSTTIPLRNIESCDSSRFSSSCHHARGSTLATPWGNINIKTYGCLSQIKTLCQVRLCQEMLIRFK